MPATHCDKLLLMLLLAGARAASRGRRRSRAEQAQKRFKMAEGFEVELFASEPMVRQPVTMTFDDRGRMWVIQYLQYPNPAGLKPVAVDRYLRTKYDRVPEPPPQGSARRRQDHDPGRHRRRRPRRHQPRISSPA